MRTSPRIGNDVVDLAPLDARGKALDARFCQRVFTERERAAIAAASDPDRLLWSLWAAKEAGYKVLRKARGSQPFSPRTLEVEIAEAHGAPGAAQILAAGVRLCVRWEQAPEWIHCLVWEAVGDVPAIAAAVRPAAALVSREDAMPKGLSARELEHARDPLSQAARLLAKQLIRGVFAEGVEILRLSEGGEPGPPRLVVAAIVRDDVDLSLSHDGRFVAAAVTGPFADADLRAPR